MPHIECSSVLAHEYAHIYGLMRDLLKISLPWLRAFATLFLKQSFLKKGKLASIIRENMKQSDNPVYV